MSEMVERVARAIEEALQIHGDADIRAGLAFLQLEFVARTAIEAMRGPTEPMLKAAQEHLGQQSYTDVWQAMIDAALK